MKKLLLFIALLLPFLVPADIYSQIYVWIDEQGVRHYTNVPSSGKYQPVTLKRLNNEPRKRSVPVNPKYDKSSAGNPGRYEKYIRNAAVAHQLDPLLIKAVIKAESDFNPYAVSSSGARGLMQLMPETAFDMRVDNPFDPQQNINGGTRYLKNLLVAYNNDLTRSLAAYNAGPGKVAQNGPLPRIRETREYVQRVIQYYRSYQQTAQTETSQNIRVRKLVTAN